MASTLANLALVVCGIGIAGLLYRQAQAQAQPPRTLFYILGLGALSLALAALGRITLTRAGPDQQTLQLMLDNLAYYAGLPLMATVAVAHGWKTQWSRAAWGRWLLALFALFELLRRSDLGDLYSQGLALMICVAMLAGVLKGFAGKAWLCGIAATLVLTVALLLLGPAALLSGYQQDALYRLSLAGFLLLYGYSFSLVWRPES